MLRYCSRCRWLNWRAISGRWQKALPQKTALWIAWPKKTSGVKTDLDGNIVREFGLDAGWVDYKVCAIDETWSGLCFARRKSPSLTIHSF